MEVQPDFKELLALFNKNDVEYVVVGGYALAFHGAPRFTGDIDLLVSRNPSNTQRVLASLSAFGFGELDIQASDLQTPDQIIQLGYPPVRIDLLTSISGVTWDTVWASHDAGTYGDLPIPYIGRDQLIANKRASGRAKDQADLEALGEA
ncbi:MAG: nucleotidyl transferase AbiEii/AbiGii toxin family protein [Algisphaera sp.]